MATSVVESSTAMEAVKIDEIPKKLSRIQVSNTKKPQFFYFNLAKRYMMLYNDVELSALGMAIPTVVTIAEKLKSNGLAIEKQISTSTVDIKDDSKGRPIQKAKLEILLGKTEKFENMMIAAAAKASSTDENFNKLKSNSTAVDAKAPSTNESFNKLESSSTAVDAKAPSTDDNFNKLESSSTAVDAKAPSTDENLNKLESNSTAVDAKAPSTDENLNKLESNSTAIVAKAPSTKENLNKLESSSSTAAVASNNYTDKKEA